VAKPVLEPPGGAVPLDSAYYIVRPADVEFEEAIARGDSTVLVRGARQMGKTSLLARGVQRARQENLRVILTDYQKLNASCFESIEKLFVALGESLANQLDLDKLPCELWDSRRSPNSNFERYLRREVLEPTMGHLVWAMDEVDRVFACKFSSEFFSLLRAWHNDRGFDPSGPFSKLTLAIAHATEPYLFITNLDESPFNVGTRVTLADFTPEQVASLNQLYGAPLKSEADIGRFVGLVGGHPFLVRRGLHELAAHSMSLDAFEAQAAQDDGVFGDHLRRNLAALARDEMLVEVVRKVLRGDACPTAETFFRLGSSGILAGDSHAEARLRCKVYAVHMKRHLL
jgi:hypothetical protein